MPIRFENDAIPLFPVKDLQQQLGCVPPRAGGPLSQPSLPALLVRIWRCMSALIAEGNTKEANMGLAAGYAIATFVAVALGFAVLRKM